MNKQREALTIAAKENTTFAYRRERSPGWEWSVNVTGDGGKPYVFQTQQEAESLIALLRQRDLMGVEQGLYSIDGPNDMGDEFEEPRLNFNREGGFHP